MIHKILLSLLILFLIGFVSAEPILHTPQIITVSSGKSTFPISFFNDGDSANFKAKFISNVPFAYLQEESINVDKETYGSFSLILGDSKIIPGIYFGKAVIYDNLEELFIIPVIFGKESDLPKKFDVSIIFDESKDTKISFDEITISPTIDVYKLDYNPSTSNNVIFDFIVYDLNGNILESSEKTIAVSTRSSFEQFSNLGANYPSGVVLASMVRNAGSLWLDVAQINLPKSDLLLSPAVEKKDFSSWIYFGVFIFLIVSMMFLNYFWNRRIKKQANDWSSHVDYIKKTQFSDAAKSIRNLNEQKNVLERAYKSSYITKGSYQRGIIEIDKLTTSLKKRL